MTTKKRGSSPKKAKPTEQRSVAEIMSKLRAGCASLDWLEHIQNHAKAYLEVDKQRPGAALLRLALLNSTAARLAVTQNKAHAAAVLAMGALQAAWQAEIIEGRPMIDAGVTAWRKGEDANLEKSRRASTQHKAWCAEAEKIKAKNPHLSKTDIAKRIDRQRANTVRRYI